MNARIEPDHDIRSNVHVMRQVWSDEEVVIQMSVVPSYVHSADDLEGGHGCRPFDSGSCSEQRRGSWSLQLELGPGPGFDTASSSVSELWTVSVI